MKKRRCTAKMQFFTLFSLLTVSTMDPVYFFTTQQKLQFVPFCRWPISVLSDLKSRQSIRMHMQAIPLPLPLPRSHTLRCRSVPYASRYISCLLPAREPSNYHMNVYAHTSAQKRNTGQCIIRRSLVEL